MVNRRQINFRSSMAAIARSLSGASRRTVKPFRLVFVVPDPRAAFLARGDRVLRGARKLDPQGSCPTAILLPCPLRQELFTIQALTPSHPALGSRRGPAPVVHFTLPPAGADYGSAAADFVKSGARAALLLAGARDAARIVKALRAAGFSGSIVGGAPLGRRPFPEEAGEAAEGVVFPLLFDATHPRAAPFVRAYEARWGASPDFLAAHAYDADRMTIEAVRRAGPNRALIRDALAAFEAWSGACGMVRWDATGCSVRSVSLGTWQDGRASRLQ